MQRGGTWRHTLVCFRMAGIFDYGDRPVFMCHRVYARQRGIVSASLGTSTRCSVPDSQSVVGEPSLMLRRPG